MASEKSVEEIAAAAAQNAALYQAQVPPELDPARRLLEQYSGIPPEDADAHIIKIRDAAWAVFPYGGIGSFKFLDMNATLQDPTFQAVIGRLKDSTSSETFLDVGCCLGHVSRQLIVSGVASERVYGIDLQPRFLDFGYDLFRDREVSKPTFLSGDILKDNEGVLDQLRGRVDIVYASAFFHLWERDNQKKAARRMIGFLNPDNRNAMIFGVNGGPKVEGWEKYVLRGEEWKQLWLEVGEETGTSWVTEQTTVEDRNDWLQVRFTVQRS